LYRDAIQSGEKISFKDVVDAWNVHKAIMTADDQDDQDEPPKKKTQKYRPKVGNPTYFEFKEALYRDAIQSGEKISFKDVVDAWNVHKAIMTADDEDDEDEGTKRTKRTR
jgi:hypothetical protein